MLIQVNASIFDKTLCLFPSQKVPDIVEVFHDPAIEARLITTITNAMVTKHNQTISPETNTISHPSDVLLKDILTNHEEPRCVTIHVDFMGAGFFGECLEQYAAGFEAPPVLPQIIPCVDLFRHFNWGHEGCCEAFVIDVYNVFRVVTGP
jgi:hypothetical protein